MTTPQDVSDLSGTGLVSRDRDEITNVQAEQAGSPQTATRKRPRAPYVPVTYTCGGCDNRWAGISRAHCSGCHRTWASVDLFDRHRKDVKRVGTCIDPATLTDKDGKPTQVFRDGLWRSTRVFTDAGALFGRDNT